MSGATDELSRYALSRPASAWMRGLVALEMRGKLAAYLEVPSAQLDQSKCEFQGRLRGWSQSDHTHSCDAGCVATLASGT